MSYVIVALLFTVIGVILGIRYRDCIEAWFDKIGF